MTDVRPTRGIVNGHWEPTPHEPPKVVTLVVTGVTKLIQKITHHSEKPANAGQHDGERHEPMAAE